MGRFLHFQNSPVAFSSLWFLLSKLATTLYCGWYQQGRLSYSRFTPHNPTHALHMASALSHNPEPCFVLTFHVTPTTAIINDAGPSTQLAPPSKRPSKLRYGRGVLSPPACISLLICLQSTCAICIFTHAWYCHNYPPSCHGDPNCFSWLPCSLLLPFIVDVSRYMSAV